MTAVPGGGNTVEQIDAPGDSLQQIGGKSDSHKITRDLWRQASAPRCSRMRCITGFGLSYREASDGDPGPGAVLQCSPRESVPRSSSWMPPWMMGHRVWRPGCSVRQSVMHGLATVQPAERPLHSVAGRLTRGLPWNHVVERHRHIGPELPLDLGGALRA